MEAPKSLSSYTCYTVYFVYCVHTKNDKQEIGGWIHLQKTIVFHFYQKQFLLLLFLFFFQDFDFMTPFKAVRNTFNIFLSSVISWSQARPDSKGAIGEEKKRNEKNWRQLQKNFKVEIDRQTDPVLAGRRGKEIWELNYFSQWSCAFQRSESSKQDGFVFGKYDRSSTFWMKYIDFVVRQWMPKMVFWIRRKMKVSFKLDIHIEI